MFYLACCLAKLTDKPQAVSQFACRHHKLNNDNNSNSAVKASLACRGEWEL